MSFDPVDVFGGALGSLLKRLAYFVSAIWIGCMVGAGALITSFLVAGAAPDLGMLWLLCLAPVALLNAWFIVNFFIVVIGFAYSVKAEEAGFRGWMILAGLASLGVKLGDGFGSARQWLPLLAGWTAWLVLLVMLGAGVWLLRQYFIHRWAHHLVVVQTETTLREAENDEVVRARLKATRPPEPPPGVIVELKR